MSARENWGVTATRRLTHQTRGLKIWVRLMAALFLVIAAAGAGLLAWAIHVQRDTAQELTRDFAESVHQMTLAGLTGMMITGTSAQRAVFLDQIRRSNNIQSLRLVRGDEVTKQFGPGAPSEGVEDALEDAVLRGARPIYKIRHRGDHEVMRAVLPIVASRDSLGKDCLTCHRVAEGVVLGAVSMEISLDKVNLATAAFTRNVAWLGALIALPLAIVIYIFLSRLVTVPLRELTAGLQEIARGGADPSRRLRVTGNDEIAEATDAFNRVLDKAFQMVNAELVATDVFEHALEGIVVCDAKSRIIKVNPAFTRTTGYRPDEVIGKAPSILSSGRHDATFYEAFWGALAEQGQWQGDIWNRRKDGEIYPEWLNVSMVRNAAGEPQYYIGIFSDITERKRQEALIVHQAHHDALTGLPNRVLFKDRLEQALATARRHGEQALAVAFIDLDRFKWINDTLGHDAGDQLLKEVARRLRAAVREVDTVARLGGDEFAVCLPEVANLQSVEVAAARMLNATRLPYSLNGKDHVVTISIGVSLYPRDGGDAGTLIKNADIAMYHVKRQGRAGFCLYSTDLDVQTASHSQLEEELRYAVARHALGIVYEPQFSLQNAGIVGVEARANWQHPRLGTVPQREFLKVAEDTGLIAQIGEWLMQTACSQVAAWIGQGFGPMILSINLSSRQFLHDGLEAVVRRALAESALPAACLELGISEPLAMLDIDRTTLVLAKLKRCGVRLALTEFGSGLRAAVSGLRALPVDSIKIEQAYLGELCEGIERVDLLPGLLSLAQQPQRRIVATGVEHEHQAERLRALQCNVAQGGLFYPPAPAETMTRLLRKAPLDAARVGQLTRSTPA